MSPGETYVPYFEVTIKGTNLIHGVTVDVLSLSVTDTANQADSFSITVRDRHPQDGYFASGRQLRWMDDGLFDEGNEVKIEVGYVNGASFTFTGEITAISASFPENGLPTLAVRGFSKYHRLQKTRRTKPFVSESISGIAEEAAKALKLGSVVEVVDVKRPYEGRTLNQTYAAILKERAEPYGFEVVVKGDTLYFESPRYLMNPGPAATLEWGKDLRSFSPSLSTYNMVTEVSVRAIQTSKGGKKEPIVSRAGASDVEGKMGNTTGPQVAEKTFGKNPMLYGNHDIENPKEAAEIAKAQLGLKAIEFITGRGSVIGDPRIMARNVIELKGLGTRFSGNYYVTSATHTIDASGYRTDFEVKRNARQ